MMIFISRDSQFSECFFWHFQLRTCDKTVRLMAIGNLYRQLDNVWLMLAQRRKRWADIKQTFGLNLVQGNGGSSFQQTKFIHCWPLGSTSRVFWALDDETA